MEVGFDFGLFGGSLLGQAPEASVGIRLDEVVRSKLAGSGLQRGPQDWGLASG